MGLKYTISDPIILCSTKYIHTHKNFALQGIPAGMHNRGRHSRNACPECREEFETATA